MALRSDGEAVKAAFVSWIRESPRHFGAFLRVSAEEFESADNKLGVLTFQHLSDVSLLRTRILSHV